MAEAAVQLKLAGQTYRVVTSADEGDLTRLARVVEEAIHAVTTPGRQPSPQAVVLAAITLAHELELERERRQAIETRHRGLLTSLLGRIDRVLADTDLAEQEHAEPERREARREPARALEVARDSMSPSEPVRLEVAAALDAEVPALAVSRTSPRSSPLSAVGGPPAPWGRGGPSSERR